MKKHKVFIIFFGISALVFLWKLIIMKGAFLGGDYSEQFYPWSIIYAESIKNFQFPFWTRYVQSGFPLMAEGQIGGFYPLHMIFYFFLPFRVAYNYLIILHFVMAGVFTYVYSGKMGACRWGSTLAAFIFCFGSAYAGCMINTATLKALAWFPLVLFLLERYFDEKRFFFIIVSGIVLGIQLLSGSAQVALYSVLMCLLYFTTGVIVRRDFRLSNLFCLIGLPAIAFMVFFPQFVLTRTMSALSWRSGADLDFALTLSLSPLNFFSIIFPRTIFHGPGTYITILGVLFLVSAFMSIKKNSRLFPILAVLFAAIFISLGRYNPIFVLLIKSMEFYDFRGPSKVILFALFSASILAGTGFTAFFASENLQKRALKNFSVILSFFLVIFFVTKSILLMFSDNIITFGENLVQRYIHGKPFHRYDLEMYMEKTRGFYNSIVRSFSLEDPFVLFSIFVSIFFIIMAVYFLRGKKIRPLHKPIFISVIFIDLLVFSAYGTGFRGNIRNFSFIEPESNIILDKVLEDTGIFRIFPYDLASRKLPNWCYSSLNLIYGVDSVALYTPLANDYYRKEVEELEIVDNALGLKRIQKGILDKNLNLIKALNTKYVVSPEKLEVDFLNLLIAEENMFLYELKSTLPRAFVSRDVSLEGIDDSIHVDITSYSSGRASFEVTMPYKGFLVFSENRYPGWRVTVNGERQEVESFSVMQAVRVGEGKNVVEFIYDAWASVKL